MNKLIALALIASISPAAAGGITTWAEIDQLDAAGDDAGVGMAVYTGQLPLPRP